MPLDREESIRTLREAGEQRNLTLYLGAGVSVANGLPTWDQLVLAMYFAAISEQQMHGWRPYSNYLFAIAQWHLDRSREPLEIVARKVRRYYRNQEQFFEHLRLTLYQGFSIADSEEFQSITGEQLRQANATLDAVARLCTGSGVRSVVTYNYDSLLEMALDQHAHQPIFRNARVESGRLPIYHVHGYVPMSASEASAPDEIVFTEDQYHLSAQDSYSWRNLVQIQAMARSVGLMIGLSLADRNMRRFLDAVRRTPVPTQNFALLKRPERSTPDEDELDEIHRNAISYLDRFEKSGVKCGSASHSSAVYPRPGVKSAAIPGIKGEPIYRQQIRGILGEVERFALAEDEFVFNDLGVTPIWYDDHSEIPELVEQILSRPGGGRSSRRG